MSKKKPDTKPGEESSRSFEALSRKTYAPPQLTRYGDLASLTRGSLTSGDDMMFGGSEGGT